MLCSPLPPAGEGSRNNAFTAKPKGPFRAFWLCSATLSNTGLTQNKPGLMIILFWLSRTSVIPLTVRTPVIPLTVRPEYAAGRIEGPFPTLAKDLSRRWRRACPESGEGPVLSLAKEERIQERSQDATSPSIRHFAATQDERPSNRWVTKHVLSRPQGVPKGQS